MTVFSVPVEPAQGRRDGLAQSGHYRTLTELLRLLKPYPADRMEEWHVGDEARNPRNDYPELIKKIDETKENKPEQERMI